MWIGEVAMNVWIRFFLAGAMALPAASISPRWRGPGPRSSGPLTCSATSFVASNCAGEETGKARLDDIHAEHRELPGDLELLRDRHGRPGRLLAVA